MPPEENTNKNTPNLDTFKVGIDPVFKDGLGQPKNTASQNAPASAFNVLNNQQYTPSQAPQNNASNLQKDIASITGKNTANPKSIVRTYKGDLASAIATNHLSSINIAVAENEKMHSQLKAEPAETASAGDYSKNKIIIFTSIILVMVGVIGISLVYLFKNSNSTPVVQVQTLPSLITTEYKDELNISTITGNGFVTALSSKLNDTQIPANDFYSLYITTGTSTARRLITSSEFVSLMGFKMPDIIKRVLASDFMVGTYSGGENLLFVILKTSSFDNAYAGMLAWEVDLARDLGPLFRLSGYNNGSGILAQLTPTTVKKFEDGVIVNKDVRLLRDDNGQIILLYGIIDTQTIVITTNDTAFKKIVDRLNKEAGLAR